MDLFGYGLKKPGQGLHGPHDRSGSDPAAFLRSAADRERAVAVRIMPGRVIRHHRRALVGAGARRNAAVIAEEQTFHHNHPSVDVPCQSPTWVQVYITGPRAK